MQRSSTAISTGSLWCSCCAVPITGCRARTKSRSRRSNSPVRCWLRAYSTQRLGYPVLAARWLAAFGPGSVACVPFLEGDKQTFHKLPERILHAGGAALEGIEWTKPLSGLANPALSALATEVLRIANPLLRTSAVRPTTTRARSAYIGDHWPGPGIQLTGEALDALDQLNLPLKAAAGSALAAGHEWSAWADQPAAPLGSQPVLAQSEQDAILRDLERAGLVRTHQTRNWLPGQLATKLIIPLRWARR